MKNIFYYLTMFFGVLMVSSCDPSQSADGDFLNGINYKFGEGAKNLKKITTHLKDDTGAWEDNMTTFTYTTGQLSSYKDTSGVTKVEYNSNNKISKLSNPAASSVFEYSDNNVSKITTTIPGSGKITSNFSYSSGRLSKTISVQEYTSPLPLKLYTETSYDYQGINMTKSVVKGGMYNAAGTLIMDPKQKTITATYDTKRSPYRLLPTEYVIYLTGLAPQGGIYLSGNNFLQVVTAETGSPAKTQSFVHTYDGLYPTKSTSGEEYILYQY